MTLSSMFSPVRKEDKELLLTIAETIETLVKIGNTAAIDLAEKFGQNYLDLEKKIQTNDYLIADQVYYKIENLIKRNHAPE